MFRLGAESLLVMPVDDVAGSDDTHRQEDEDQQEGKAGSGIGSAGSVQPPGLPARQDQKGQAQHREGQDRVQRRRDERATVEKRCAIEVGQQEDEAGSQKYDRSAQRQSGAPTPDRRPRKRGQERQAGEQEDEGGHG